MKAWFTIHRLAWLGLVFTIGLTIGIGGTITSTEVGMAYPTWPNINGSSLFNIFYGKLSEAFGVGSVVEHTHRQAASLTGLIMLVLAIMTWVKKETPKRMRNLATVSLLVVIFQGLLGANRVLANDYLVAIFHAVGAQLVVALLVLMVKESATSWERPAQPFPAHRVDRLRLWTTTTMVLLFLNLFAAASLRQKQGAFTGHLILAITTACVLLFVIQQVLTKFRGHVQLQRLAKTTAHALGTQLALGVAAWAFLLGPLIGSFPDEDTRFLFQSILATAHLLCGVLVLALVTAIWQEAKHKLKPEVSA
jgi:heme A synthase